MGKPYHTIEKKDTQLLARFLVQNGQALLPMVQLIEHSKLAVDELIDVLGRASIEAVLQLSAAGIAGPPHPGKKGGAVGWHGGESGTVCLAERKLRIRRPRLRKKQPGQDGEVPIPAYQAMQADDKLGSGCWRFCCGEFRRGSTKPCCRRWPRRWVCPSPASARRRSKPARKNFSGCANGDSTTWTSW